MCRSHRSRSCPSRRATSRRTLSRPPTRPRPTTPAAPASRLPVCPVRQSERRCRSRRPATSCSARSAAAAWGVVFRARDLSLNRDVAVKLLQDKYAPGSLAAKRFTEEARITGQLQHPGIPPVHQVGTFPDGRPFLVMKLIKGHTLADILASRERERPEGDSPEVSRGSLVAVFEQVCQAVAYAHNRGVIHRDLKPANVMVGAFGEVQVMDWGLAKFRADGRADTAEAATAST